MPDDEELRVPSVRQTPDEGEIRTDLDLLSELEGSWRGKGFNLVARPDKEGGANLYLELNQTDETLKFDAIGSAIPNRGFEMNDIELFGLTYLQKISDDVTGGALHIEPGIWVTQPSTTAPPEQAANGTRIVGRMGSIPHGNSILAEGLAQAFTGNPVVAGNGVPYNGSVFPSFNSTPFLAGGAIFAAGTAEFDVPVPPPGPVHGFTQYTLTNAPSAANPRTPYGNSIPVPLPTDIHGVPMQLLVNDPILLLQAVVNEQLAAGHTFEGTVINISSQATLQFGTTPNQPAPSTTVNVPIGGGSIGNIPFLQVNAPSALVYATFWIERVTHPKRRRPFHQLQYAQMVLLNFPILAAPPPPPGQQPVVLSWPHITVGTLQKDFH